MARKRKTSIKPVGKRAQSKGKEKPEENSSDMSGKLVRSFPLDPHNAFAIRRERGRSRRD